jgi:chromosomal replication initiator protein
VTPQELAERYGSTAFPTPVVRIIAATAEAFGLEPSALLGKDRCKSHKEARLVAYLVARRCTRMSFPELGRAFGKSHTSVHAGVHSMGVQCARDPWLAEVVAQLIERFGEVEEREREQ